MIFSIIGGDERQIFLAKRLKKDGHTVRLCGFENRKDIQSLSLGDALFLCDCIILPLPTTKDKKTVFTPLGNEILLSDCINTAPKNALFLTAGTKLGVLNECDYFSREDMTVKNAALTAEGAVAAAINNSDFALLGHKCLVVGFGRIGKFLCHRLSAFGCEITCAARRKESRAMIESLGFKALDTNSLNTQIGEFDYIFSTTTETVLKGEILAGVSKDALIIELASPPFGCDIKSAADMGLSVIKASGLPAKTSPKTAADIIYSTVNDILNEML